jgi:hypothetical protein
MILRDFTGDQRPAYRLHERQRTAQIHLRVTRHVDPLEVEQTQPAAHLATVDQLHVQLERAGPPAGRWLG